MDARILEPQADGVLVGRRRLAAGDVHRVAGGAEGRDEFAECGIQVFGHGHERQAVVHAGVREQHAGSAGAGDDDDVLALGRRQLRDAARVLQKVAQRTGADDAALVEDVLVDLVVSGQRPGVGTGGTGAEAGAAGLQDHHRLLPGDALRGFGEGAAVLQVLAMLGDDLGVLVLLEEREQIVLVDVRLVAQADDGRHPHLGGTGKTDDGHADATGLGREGRLALDVVRGAEGGAQVFRRVVEAVDVRTHEADVVLAGDFDDFPLSFDIARLGEAGRNQHGTGDLLLAHFDECLGDELGGDGEDRDIDPARHVLDALVGLAPHDLVSLGVDRVDRALIAAVDEVFHHRIADLAVFRRGADHGDRIRLHDAVHLAHDVFLLRAVLRNRGREVEDDAHVGGDGVGFRREHRVQIHLGNFGEVRDEVRDAFDQRCQRFAIHRLGAAHPFQDLGGGNAVQHRPRVLARGGREAEGDVLQHLDQHAAQTEGDQLAEGRIRHRADDHFLAAAEHLLHLHAEQGGLGIVLAGVLHDGDEAPLDIRGVLQADQHTARFGLVQDLRGNDLEHHRKSHVRRQLRGLRGRFRHPLLGHRDPVRVAHQLAFRRGEGGSPFRLHPIEYLSDRRLIVSHDCHLQFVRNCGLARRPGRPWRTGRNLF